MINSNPERELQILLRGKPVTKKKNTKWVPKVMDKFWYVWIWRDDGSIKICRNTRSGWETNDAYFTWNVFRTKREAQKAAKAIDKILRGE